MDALIADNLNLIHQLPGIVMLTDLEHKFITANQHTAEIIGFSSPEAMCGFSYEDMHCKAAADSQLFIQQDCEIIQSHKELTLLSYYRHADDWRLLIGTKKLFYNANHKPIGVIHMHSDISYSTLVDANQYILSSLHEKNTKQFCFEISDTPKNIPLNGEEFEVLYLLLRNIPEQRISRLLTKTTTEIDEIIERILQIMGCSTRKQMLEAAIESDLHHIIPKSFFRLGK